MKTVYEQFASPMNQVIHGRRSVRQFSKKPVPHELLIQLVEAGIAAPSGSNWQNQRFLVIADRTEIVRIGRARFVWPYKSAKLAEVWEKYPDGIVGKAPAIIIVFADSSENDRRTNGEYYVWENLEIQNCAASIENILLMATAMGLGSCWVSASDQMSGTRMFSRQSWRKVLSKYAIPSYFKIQGIVLLGFPERVDENGFAKGENMHGATVWQSTKRRPVDYYLIKERSQEPFQTINVLLHDRIAVRCLSLTLRLLQRLSRWCDRRIHRIEIEKYLKRGES